MNCAGCEEALERVEGLLILVDALKNKIADQAVEIEKLRSSHNLLEDIVNGE